MFPAAPAAPFARNVACREILVLGFQDLLLDETLDSVSTVFNEIAQHPPHTLFAVCKWSIGHPR